MLVMSVYGNRAFEDEMRNSFIAKCYSKNYWNSNIILKNVEIGKNMSEIF